MIQFHSFTPQINICGEKIVNKTAVLPSHAMTMQQDATINNAANLIAHKRGI